jgi:protein-S-isoprenylcysteine O-methyltransferase Ste14
MTRVAAILYGGVAYAVFLASSLYTVGFVGNLLAPKSIDSGRGGPLGEALVIDACLLGLFAVQHSVMARQGFKRWWRRFAPPSLERSTYVLAASLVLLLLYWQWRPIPAVVWTIENEIAAAAIMGVFWLAWGMLIVSTFLISHLELFGLAQVFAHVRGGELPPPVFKTPLFYKLVRHPIFLSFLLAFWSTTTMTVGRLLFAVATTVYVLIAIQLEERDLIRIFGDRYRRYRSDVAMLVPMPWRPKAEHRRSMAARRRL